MERDESVRIPRRLTLQQRAEIFDRTVAKVTKEYFDPNFRGTEWPMRAQDSRKRILALEDNDAFELGMHDLVRSLGTSHTGFFHQSLRRVPGRLSIGVSFRRAETSVGTRWVVQDVHEGGPAHTAGLHALDLLEAVNGKPALPPEQPMFPMDTIVALSIRRGSESLELTVAIPPPRSRQQPYAEPRAVTSAILADGIGYMKVTILPGLLGLDVAREIDQAIMGLNECSRLILDLRGHLGGGLAVLRLMSYLTPGRVPIGYTVTRKQAEIGYEKANLRTLDRLPTHLPNALAVASMALRFIGRDPSVLLFSEGLGTKTWHGRIVVLINEHTVSAGEMVAAFAQQNGLAKLVGSETAGRLIPGSGFKVGQGYMLIMPKAEYVTWQGRRFEGVGIRPDVAASWSADAAGAGVDNQLQTAIEIVKEM